MWDAKALPPTRSQERRWTRAIRTRLGEWVRNRARGIVEEWLSRVIEMPKSMRAGKMSDPIL